MPTDSQVRERVVGGEKLRRAIVCPHCWHQFETADIVWVARHAELRGDPVLGPDHFLRFLPTRFTVTGDALDARSMPCQSFACPACHLVIPRMFLQYEALIFSLIGVPFSGKSYFLSSMTWELGRILPTYFGLTFSDVDPASNVTINEYQRMLFHQHGADRLVGIDKTQLDAATHYQQTNMDGQAVLLPRPFLFRMTPQKNVHPNADRSEEFTRLLCLYDNAGEHFLPGQDSALTPGTQHMGKSKILMFMYDPIQDPRFQAECAKISSDPQIVQHGKSKQQATVVQSTILTEAVSRVRQHAHLPINKPLTQPLLVLVSKADIWCKLIRENLETEPIITVKSDKNEPCLLNRARIRRVSAKVRQMMIELAPEFVATAEDACTQVMYFPISALGCSPVSMQDSSLLLVRPVDIKPRWVTVPFLYAFSVWASGLVTGKDDPTETG